MRLSATLVLAGVIWSTATEAQLLFRPGEPYINYAYESYRSYENLIFGRDRTPQFDPLGQFVLNGATVFQLQEFRTIRPAAGSIIAKPRLYEAYLNRLVIANDSYKGANSQLIIGDRIRTKYTSLTLDLAAMNGIRLDTHFKGGSVVLATSRVDKPIFESVLNADHRIHGTEGSEFRPRWSTYLMSGDVRTQLPSLDMGLSWVNQYRTDSFKKLSENSFKGTLPTTGRPPEWIVVRVSDQVPEDNAGVRVTAPVLTLNGRQVTHVLGPYDKLDTETLTLTVTKHEDQTIIPPITRDTSNDLIIDHPHVEPTPQGFYETRGRGSLLFWFKVPAFFADNGDTVIVTKTYVSLDVAGDYAIELSEVFDGLSRNPATYFYTAAQSRGRPANLNDFKRVRADYGRQTGRTLASAHLNLDIRGFSLNTEYVRNFSHRAYPSIVSTKNHHLLNQSQAWFAVLRRDWDRFTIGGEVFNVDGEYSTVLTVQDDDFRSYSGFLTSPFQFPNNYHEPRLPTFIGPNIADQTYTIEFNTVDDNDDKDPFPDSYFLRRTTNLATGGRFIEDPDGVFPGLDADLNGRPDINENNNQIPDYFEPFLLYKVNPDAFEWGDDTNNNGKIDERENDEKPDYPYDADRRGFHGFTTLFLSRAMSVTLGHHDTWAPFGGGQATSTYGKVEYRRRIPFLVDLYAVERLKRVQDDIADDVFGLRRSPIYFEPDVIPIVALTDEEIFNPLGEAELLQDPLLMQDSWVNTFFTRTRLIRVPSLNVELTLKYENNFQQSTSRQPDNRISDLATVFKAGYQWNPWRELQIIPQFKWLRQRLQDDENALLPIHENFLYPILRLEYPLSSRTTIKLGAQGFSFFTSKYRNELTPAADFDSEVYLVLLSNNSTYVGYQLNLNLGYEKRVRTFLDQKRSAQDIDFSRLFLRLIVGLRPLY